MMVKKNVLIANQDFHELNIIYKYLEETEHYNIMNAANSKTAKYIINSKKIDLALLDWETFNPQNKNEIDYFYQKSQQLSTKLIVLLDKQQKHENNTPYLFLQKPIDQNIAQKIEEVINNSKKETFSNKQNTSEQLILDDYDLQKINNGKGTIELASNDADNQKSEKKEEIVKSEIKVDEIDKEEDNSRKLNKTKEEGINNQELLFEESTQIKQENEYKAIIFQIEEEKQKTQLKNGENLRSVKALKTSNPLFYDLIQQVLPVHLAELIEKHPDSQVDYYPEISCFILKFEDLSVAEAKYGDEVHFFLEKLFEYFQDFLNQKELERVISQTNTFLAINPIHLSLENQTEKILEFAQHCNHFIQKIYTQRRKVSNFCLNYIIEIHTSSLIAGRIGKHTFAYDIFGKTTQNFINPSISDNVPVLVDEASKNLLKLDNLIYLGEFTNQFKEELKIYQYI